MLVLQEEPNTIPYVEPRSEPVKERGYIVYRFVRIIRIESVSAAGRADGGGGEDGERVTPFYRRRYTEWLLISSFLTS